MKRADFKIEGIPEGYRVYDVDLTPSGRPVAGIAHLHDQTAPAFIITGAGQSVLIPDDLLWPYGDLNLKPRVRAAGEGLLVAQRMRARHDAERTAWIWTGDGQFVSSFAGGDDCEELLADSDHLLLFYGDEGQTGGQPLGRQAMVVRAADGSYLWGHVPQFGKEAFTVWFQAAAWAGPHEAVIFADVKHKSAFVRLDVSTRRQTVWYPPSPISIPTAVTAMNGNVLLHGASGTYWNKGPSLPRRLHLWLTGAPSPRDDTIANPRVAPEDVVEWRPGESTWRVIGKWPARQLRGLPGGRFIAVQPDGYTILSFD